MSGDNKEPVVKSKEVIPYRERLYCPKCDIEMKTNGMCHPMSIPTYGHVCPKCGFTKYTDYVYPRIVYYDKSEE